MTEPQRIPIVFPGCREAVYILASALSDADVAYAVAHARRHGHTHRAEFLEHWHAQRTSVPAEPAITPEAIAQQREMERLSRAARSADRAGDTARLGEVMRQMDALATTTTPPQGSTPEGIAP